MKKIAVILSGCGVYDGAEIHEATLSLLAIAKAGATYHIFAPDIPQHHVVNHLTGQATNESRNVLVESARIARGNIQPLADYNALDFDALLIPGGFGVAKNLSSIAFDGAKASVDPSVEQAIRQTHAAQKPIGALCIAPAMIARIITNAEVTIGNDPGTAQAIQQMGATHVEATHGEVVVDQKNKIATTPCYMLDANIVQIAEGAEHVVEALMKMMD